MIIEQMERAQTLFFCSVMLVNPSMFLEYCMLIISNMHVGFLFIHSTYCGKVTLASQFEVTEESLYGIRIAQFRTVGALEVKASSSALI